MPEVSTQKLYVSKIKSLRNKYGIKDLNKYDDVMDNLKNIPEVTIKNFICAIIWFDKNVGRNIQSGEYQKLDDLVIEKYKRKMYDISKKQNDFDESGIMTEKQKQNFLEWGKIIMIRDNMIQENESLLDTLIICLYTLIPPRRLEYVKMIYIDHELDEKEEDIEKNYCVNIENEMYFIFNNYKTKKSIGRIKFTVPERLKNIIMQYVKKNNIMADDLLLKINTESSLTKKIKNIINKKSGDNSFSVQILRHSFASWVYMNSKYLSPKEWRKISKLMGHSHNEHMNYSKNIDVEDDNKINFKNEIKDIVNITII